MKELIIDTLEIIDLLQTLEQQFQEDLSFFKQFVTDNKLKYIKNDYKINFYGYYEINDYFRRHLIYKTPKQIHKGNIEFLLQTSESKFGFFDHRDEELYNEDLNKELFELKQIDLRTFSMFCY
ncbi:MAG: hypothetical protein ACRCW9_03050 [Cetobacterium sp.]